MLTKSPSVYLRSRLVRLTCCCWDWWPWASACRPSPPAGTPACWNEGTTQLHSSNYPSATGKRTRLVEQTRRVRIGASTPGVRGARAHLGGKLDEEVVIRSEGADAGALADGGGQRFDLIEAAVQLVQTRQPEMWEGLNSLIISILIHSTGPPFEHVPNVNLN